MTIQISNIAVVKKNSDTVGGSEESDAGYNFLTITWVENEVKTIRLITESSSFTETTTNNLTSDCYGSVSELPCSDDYCDQKYNANYPLTCKTQDPFTYYCFGVDFSFAIPGGKNTYGVDKKAETWQQFNFEDVKTNDDYSPKYYLYFRTYELYSSWYRQTFLDQWHTDSGISSSCYCIDPEEIVEGVSGGSVSLGASSFPSYYYNSGTSGEVENVSFYMAYSEYNIESDSSNYSFNIFYSNGDINSFDNQSGNKSVTLTDYITMKLTIPADGSDVTYSFEIS